MNLDLIIDANHTAVASDSDDPRSQKSQILKTVDFFKSSQGAGESTLQINASPPGKTRFLGKSDLISIDRMSQIYEMDQDQQPIRSSQKSILKTTKLESEIDTVEQKNCQEKIMKVKTKSPTFLVPNKAWVGEPFIFPPGVKSGTKYTSVKLKNGKFRLEDSSIMEVFSPVYNYGLTKKYTSRNFGGGYKFKNQEFEEKRSSIEFHDTIASSGMGRPKSREMSFTGPKFQEQKRPVTQNRKFRRQKQFLIPESNNRITPNSSIAAKFTVAAAQASINSTQIFGGRITDSFLRNSEHFGIVGNQSKYATVQSQKWEDRKPTRFETSSDREPKDSIINEVHTKIASSEDDHFESVQFEGEIGEGSIHVVTSKQRRILPLNTINLEDSSKEPTSCVNSPFLPLRLGKSKIHMQMEKNRNLGTKQTENLNETKVIESQFQIKRSYNMATTPSREQEEEKDTLILQELKGFDTLKNNLMAIGSSFNKFVDSKRTPSEVSPVGSDPQMHKVMKIRKHSIVSKSVQKSEGTSKPKSKFNLKQQHYMFPNRYLCKFQDSYRFNSSTVKGSQLSKNEIVKIDASRVPLFQDYEKISHDATQYGQFSENSHRIVDSMKQIQKSNLKNFSNIEVTQAGLEDYNFQPTIIEANLSKLQKLKNIEIIDQFGVPWILNKMPNSLEKQQILFERCKGIIKEEKIQSEHKDETNSISEILENPIQDYIEKASLKDLEIKTIDERHLENFGNNIMGVSRQVSQMDKVSSKKSEKTQQFVDYETLVQFFDRIQTNRKTLMKNKDLVTKMLRKENSNDDLKYIQSKRKVNKSQCFDKNAAYVDLIANDHFLNFKQSDIERKNIIRTILQEELNNKNLIYEAKQYIKNRLETSYRLDVGDRANSSLLFANSEKLRALDSGLKIKTIVERFQVTPGMSKSTSQNEFIEKFIKSREQIMIVEEPELVTRPGGGKETVFQTFSQKSLAKTPKTEELPKPLFKQ